MATFTTNDASSVAYGAESNDKQTETVDSLIGTVNVTPSNTFAQTGTYSDALDMTTNANKAFLFALSNLISPATAGILVVSFAAALSAAPSSELAVMTQAASSAAPSATEPKHIRIGTDRKLKIYDGSGNLLTGGTSTTLIPTAAPMKEVVVSFDGLNSSTVWIKVYFDGVEELAFDSKLAWSSFWAVSTTNAFFGELLGASNHGCTFYLDDAVMRFSTDATEALHLVGYPRVRITGDVTADAQGTFSAWAVEGGGTHFGAITANDGYSPAAGATDLKDAVNSDADSWKSSTANPMPGGATLIKGQLRQVSKLTAGKNAHDMIFGAVGAAANQSTSYIGSVASASSARLAARLLMSGSVLPVFADAAANASEWGVQNPGSGSVTNYITYSPGPEWVYYTATLPVGTAPPSSTHKPIVIDQTINRGAFF